MMFEGLPRCGWRELRKWESRWLKSFLRCQIFIMLMRLVMLKMIRRSRLLFPPHTITTVRTIWSGLHGLLRTLLGSKWERDCRDICKQVKSSTFSHPALKPPFLRGSEVAKKIRGKNSLWSKVKWKCVNKTHRLLWKHLWRCCPTWVWRWETEQREHNTPSSSCFSARGWNF